MSEPTYICKPTVTKYCGVFCFGYDVEVADDDDYDIQDCPDYGEPWNRQKGEDDGR